MSAGSSPIVIPSTWIQLGPLRELDWFIAHRTGHAAIFLFPFIHVLPQPHAGHGSLFQCVSSPALNYFCGPLTHPS